MKRLRRALIITLIAASAGNASGACWAPVAEDISVSTAEPTKVRLEASRVAGLVERGFLYNIGRERIVIKTDSLATEGFLHAVLSGVCTVSLDVVLIPAGETREGRQYGARLVKQQSKSTPPSSSILPALKSADAR